jgi:hypothetical protein
LKVMPPPSIPISQRRGYEIVRLALGGTLLITTALKAHSLAIGYWTPNIFLTTPRLLVAAVEVEAILGLLLLSGRMPRAVWAVALIFFVCLAAGSLYLALEGQQDCGCLGAVHANPWWTFGFDAAAVLALATFRPANASVSRSLPWLSRLLKVAGGAAGIVALAAGAFLVLVDDPVSALARLRGEVVIVSPLISDIGDGAWGEDRTFTVVLLNTSDLPKRVIGGTTMCRCNATADLPISMQPGESKAVRVIARFTGQPGRFQREFKFYVEGTEQEIIVAWFRGRVVEPRLD